MRGLLLAACLLLIQRVSGAAEEKPQPSVKASTGVYNGVRSETPDNVVYGSFRGIKYAVPQRFKEATPVPKSSNVFDATEFGPCCYQKRSSFFNLSEDCLSLNVYTPNVHDKMKVVVIIHSGSFKEGCSSLCRETMYINTGKVVLVTLNYRLGAFGFSSFENDQYADNLGLRDQKIALQWVQENIKHFGGNPDHVVLEGYEAGAQSIGLLLNSPQTSGLYSKVITHSGNAGSFFALQPKQANVDKTKELAEAAGCKTMNSEAMAQCLIKRTPSEIMQAYEIVWPDESNFVDLTAVVEPLTASNPIVNTFNTFGNPKPNVQWMAGISANEGENLYPTPKLGFLNDLIYNCFERFKLATVLKYDYMRATSFNFIVNWKILMEYKPGLIEFKKDLQKMIGDFEVVYPHEMSLASRNAPNYTYYNKATYPQIPGLVGAQKNMLPIWLAQVNPKANDLSTSDIPKPCQSMFSAVMDFIQSSPTVEVETLKWESFSQSKKQLSTTTQEVQMIANPMKNTKFKFWQSLKLSPPPPRPERKTPIKPSKKDPEVAKKDQDANRDKIDAKRDQKDENKEQKDEKKDKINVKIDQKDEKKDQKEEKKDQKDQMDVKIDQKDEKKDQNEEKKDQKDEKKDQKEVKTDQKDEKKDQKEEKKDQKDEKKVKTDPKDEKKDQKEEKKDQKEEKKDQKDEKKDQKDKTKIKNDSKKDPKKAVNGRTADEDDDAEDFVLKSADSSRVRNKKQKI